MDTNSPPIGEDDSEQICTICTNPADSRIDKSSKDFNDLMSLLWKELNVEVKPNDFATYNLCVGCWDFLDEISDTYKALVYKVQVDANEQRDAIKNTVLQGIELRKKGNMAFLGIHSKLQVRYDSESPFNKEHK